MSGRRGRSRLDEFALPGSDVVFPLPSGLDWAGQQEFADEVAETQRNALAFQRWGSTFDMANAGPPGESLEFVNIGPFREPRAISLEVDLPGPLLNGAASSTRLQYTVRMGIGGASIVRVFYDLPRVIVAQQLSVSANRVDFIAGQSGPVSIWASPHTPRSAPGAIVSRAYTMGAGFLVADIDMPPSMATHIMLACTPTAADLAAPLFLEVITGPPFGLPNNPVPGNTTALYPMVGVTALGLGPGMLAPTVLPLAPDSQAISYRVRRTDSTNSYNFVVTWLRC